MVSVNYWIEHQGSRTSMSDTSRMILVIESDQAGRPWVEFGGNGLYNIYVLECAFALPLWYVSGINHVHCFYLWSEFFLSPSVRLARLVLIFTWRLPPFVFGVYLAGLLENPAFSVGAIGRFLGGVVNLT